MRLGVDEERARGGVQGDNVSDDEGGDGGGGGEYGACHYTLAGGVRVPRNLYFSPFAFPFSFHDSPPTLSSRVSLALSLFFFRRRSFVVFVRSFVAPFYGFPVFQEVSSFFSSFKALFFLFLLSHGFRRTTRNRRMRVAF